jgi:hypothetical protein
MEITELKTLGVHLGVKKAISDLKTVTLAV